MANKTNDAKTKAATNAIAAWREAMGYSMKEAAEALGTTEADLAAYEGADATPPKYIRLAMRALALGLTPDGERAPDGEE